MHGIWLQMDCQPILINSKIIFNIFEANFDPKTQFHMLSTLECIFCYFSTVCHCVLESRVWKVESHTSQHSHLPRLSESHTSQHSHLRAPAFTPVDTCIHTCVGSIIRGSQGRRGAGAQGCRVKGAKVLQGFHNYPLAFHNWDVIQTCIPEHINP